VKHQWLIFMLGTAFCLEGSGEDGLALSPGSSSLFNPAPITPAPESLDENSGPAPQAAGRAVFDTSMWKAFVIAEESAAMGNWHRSDRVVIKMQRMLPRNVLMSEKAGMVYMMHSEWEKALEIWYALFSSNPTRYDIPAKIGHCLLRQQDFAKAEKALRVALEFSPQPLEARLLLACSCIMQASPTTIPGALEQLSIFDMSQLAYWISADFEHYKSLLGEDGYLQLSSYILGGGESGTLEIKSIKEVRAQVYEASRRLNRLDRQLALRQYQAVPDLVDKCFELGVRGLSFDLYRVIRQGLSGEEESAKKEMATLASRYPDRALVLHFQGVLFMLLEEYDAATISFTKASNLDEDPRILADMIEAAAAAGQTDYAFTHLKMVAFRHPVLARGFLGHDSPGLRALKAHPDFQSWWNTQ
jgi:tetratricopeptide (TPR) repeat protein